MPRYTEEDVQDALYAWAHEQYTSISKCAAYFGIPRTTLQNRVSGTRTRIEVQEAHQHLNPSKETTLTQWILHADRLGNPIGLRLLLDLATEIRGTREQDIGAGRVYPPISRRWTEGFRRRHPEIKTILSRQIDASRFNGVNFQAINHYFTRLGEVIRSERYPPDAIFNVDESGFSIGSTRGSTVLVDKRRKLKGRKQPGKQEWITVIECVSASGVALPPSLIYKSKNLNSAWIPEETPRDWAFSTSNKGWTSDLHGFEWISTRFEPLTRRIDGKKRLLIIDGHSSHLTARFLALCITKGIDLCLLPPHTSHVTQPLDLSVFGPLKTYLAGEVDGIFRHSISRIARVEFTAAYIQARERAFRPQSIESGFRKAGIYPFNPDIILNNLTPPLATPPLENATESQEVDLSQVLLEDSREGTPIPLDPDALYTQIITDTNLATPKRAFVCLFCLFIPLTSI
jgi:hypothetical protein